MSDRDRMIVAIAHDRALGHQFLFEHRHSLPTPRFHLDIIQSWHDPERKRILTMAFREAGKSTLAEEVFVLRAWLGLYHNGVIIGSTEKRACEKLRAIKNEIEHNERGEDLFGLQTGPVWNEAEVILRNGVRIIAVGRGQSLRGTKHLHYRPDFCLLDDIEDEEHVRTPEARTETHDWFRNVVLPALDRAALIRMIATPLDKESLPMKLHPPEWAVQVYPVEYIDPAGERRATWAANKSLKWIDQRKAEEEKEGNIQGFMREYMCVAEDPAKKLFTAAMFRVETKVRTWHPTFAFYDPARTVNKGSASTGWAVWSWVANRMIVWDGGAGMWRPDEIKEHIFKVAEDYNPVIIGVEEDGLNEFLMQPLRYEQYRRGQFIPIVPFKAPKGKLDFIAGLQPFFAAGQIIFARDLPELRAQFLGFPSGRIDGPNALAYALRMRPGAVVYEDFGAIHVAQELYVRKAQPTYLCLNATLGLTTGVLTQYLDGRLHILADYVQEGDPGGQLGPMVKTAALEAGGPPRLVAGLGHFGDYNAVGLRGAVAKLPAELRQGGPESVGRDELRALLGRQVRGDPALRVAARAHWTINGFACGYATEVNKRGLLAEGPREGVYRTLFEGLEAFAGLLNTGMLADDGVPNVQRTASGQRWISALLTGRGEVGDAKSDWGVDVSRVLGGAGRR